MLEEAFGGRTCRKECRRIEQGQIVREDIPVLGIDRFEIPHPQHEFRFAASSPINETQQAAVPLLRIYLDRAGHACKLFGDFVDSKNVPLAPGPIDTCSPCSLHRPILGFVPPSSFPDLLGALLRPAIRVPESFGPVSFPCPVCCHRLRCDQASSSGVPAAVSR